MMKLFLLIAIEKFIQNNEHSEDWEIIQENLLSEYQKDVAARFRSSL